MTYPSGSQTPPPYATQPPPRRQRRTLNAPYVTYLLIAACVLVYFGQFISQASTGTDLLAAFGDKNNTAIIQGQYWRFFTPMFLHASILHIAFNMYALLIFGNNLERFYGHFRFLLLYILGGFAGNVVSFMMSPAQALGASTSIFGLIAAQGVFIYQNRTMIRNSRALLINTIAIAAINLLLGLSPGIDNWGHLGGLIGGLAFAWSAGPVWEQTAQFGIRTAPRSTSRVVLIAVGVFIVFSALAALKILTH